MRAKAGPARRAVAAALVAVAPAVALSSDAPGAAAAVAVAVVAGRMLRRWDLAPGDDGGPVWLVIVGLGTLARIALDALVPSAAARAELPLLALAVALVHGRGAGCRADQGGWRDAVGLAAALALLLAARELAAPGRWPRAVLDLLPCGLLLHAGGVILLAGLLALAAGGTGGQEE